MIKYGIKVKSIYVIILLLIPILFLSLNLETDSVTATKETNDSFSLIKGVQIPDTSMVKSAFPVIVTSSIIYDSTGDGQGPCANDYPIVTAIITDDGNVTRAYVVHSEVGKVNWLGAVMQQHETDETQWNVSIPSYGRGLSVKWFIEAWDNDEQEVQEYPNLKTYTVINGVPTVELTFPEGGEDITSDTLNITWTAYDPDNWLKTVDTLTFDLYYNRDDEGWKPIVEDIEELSYVWDLSKVKYSESYLIKVVADDGNGGVTEAITPVVLSMGLADFAPLSILVLSLLFITTISIYFKKKRRK